MKWFKEIRQCGTPAQAFFLNDQLVRWVQSFGHPRRHFLHVSGIAENLPISIASMKVGANWADTVASSKASSQFPDKIIWCEYGRTNSQLSELESTLNVSVTDVFSVLGKFPNQQKSLARASEFRSVWFSYIWLANLRFTIFSVRFYPIFQIASGRIENRPERVMLVTGPCIEPVPVMPALPSHITLRLLQTRQKFTFTHTIRTVND